MRLKLKNLIVCILSSVAFLFLLNVDVVLIKQISRRREYNSENNNSINKENERKDWKKILLWTDFFHSKQVWREILKRIHQGECEESRCLLTINRKNIANADAILFYGYNLRNPNGLEKGMVQHVVPLPFQVSRRPEQLYIFYSMEPPSKLDVLYLATMPSNYFNWTMGYRRDSDIYEPFGIVTKRTNGKNKMNYVSQSELKMKKFSIWIASSCFKRGPFLREEFVLALKREIKVDAFGECGTYCDNTSRIEIYGKEVGQPECEKKIQDYVFYLAFENSLCKDYITEKIFKAWKMGAIPVVFGDGDYSSFAPPKSYIDYRDFDSASDLANYMKKIASDATLYNQYFKWKEDYDVEIGAPYKPFVCDLCKKLHEHSTNQRPKSYPDIHDWFVVKGKCHLLPKYPSASEFMLLN